MSDNKELVPPQYDVNAKWDACLDLTVRRFVYSSVAGALSGLLFFRTPVTRWASVALGAGVGLGWYTWKATLFNVQLLFARRISSFNGKYFLSWRSGNKLDDVKITPTQLGLIQFGACFSLGMAFKYLM